MSQRVQSWVLILKIVLFSMFGSCLLSLVSEWEAIEGGVPCIAAKLGALLISSWAKI